MSLDEKELSLLRGLEAAKAEAEERMTLLGNIANPVALSKEQTIDLYQYLKTRKLDVVKNFDTSILIRTSSGLEFILNFNYFPHVQACLPYLQAIKVLNEAVKEISDGEKKNQEWTNALRAGDEKIIAGFNQWFLSQGFTDQEIAFLHAYLVKGKSLHRNDALISVFMDLCNLVQDKSNANEVVFNFALAYPEKFQRYKWQTTAPVKASGVGENIIYYGAPGTGKTYEINQLVAGSTVFRTSFHLDYQNADFVGSLRPQTKESEDGSDITYEFVPGPFIRAYIEAIRNESNQIFLVIEELNRGNAAAIFGDLFLLLDRDQYGKSEYDVDFSQELKSYLDKDQISAPDKLIIPNNLTLLATMNSSDQGVFTLDTAFRRRWNLKYLPIDWDNFSGKLAVERCQIGDVSDLTWPKFAKKINTLLMGAGVAEDKLLGPYFISEADLISHSLKDVLLYKVLNYLWEDVLRHKGRSIIFHESLETFGSVSDAVDKNKPVFSIGCVTELMKGV